MKTFNETTALKVASLRRQHQAIANQITALEAYLKTARPQKTAKPARIPARIQSKKPTK